MTYERNKKLFQHVELRLWRTTANCNAWSGSQRHCALFRAFRINKRVCGNGTTFWMHAFLMSTMILDEDLFLCIRGAVGMESPYADAAAVDDTGADNEAAAIALPVALDGSLTM